MTVDDFSREDHLYLMGPCQHGINRLIYVCKACDVLEAEMRERVLMRETMDKLAAAIDRFVEHLEKEEA